MSPKVGRDYREFILKPGGSIVSVLPLSNSYRVWALCFLECCVVSFQDAEEMLRNFLGRDPQQEAFLESKGLSAKL